MAIIGTWSFSGDGNGTSVQLTHRGPLQFEAFGTFGSGTVKGQYSPNNGTTWVDITSVTVSANGFVTFRIAPGDLFRPVLSGSTAPSITVNLKESTFQ